MLCVIFFVYHIHPYTDYVCICIMSNLLFKTASGWVFLMFPAGYFSTSHHKSEGGDWSSDCGSVFGAQGTSGAAGAVGDGDWHVGIQSFCCHVFGDDGVWIIKSISTEWGCFIDWYWLFWWYCHWMILWKYTSTLYEARLNTPNARNYKWHIHKYIFVMIWYIFI